MSLETDLKKVALTETQFRKLARNLKVRYAQIKTEERKNYGYKDIQSLFRGTEVKNALSTEAIIEEITKVQSEKPFLKKIQEKFEDIVYSVKNIDLEKAIGNLIGCVVMGAVLTGAGFLIKTEIDYGKLEKVYSRVYQETLIRAGDLNGDGLISKEEEYELPYEVIKGHPASLERRTKFGRIIDNVIDGSDNGEARLQKTRYLNDKLVNLKELTKWLQEYQPNKSLLNKK